MTLTEAANVMGVVTTSAPGPIPSVTSAVWSPAVQELSASAPGAPRYAANSCSNRFAFGPVVIQVDRSVSTTSWISSSPIGGVANGRKSRSGAVTWGGAVGTSETDVGSGLVVMPSQWVSARRHLCTSCAQADGLSPQGLHAPPSGPTGRDDATDLQLRWRW